MTKISHPSRRPGARKLHLLATTFLLGTTAATPPAMAQPPDTIEITRVGRTDVTNYPYQFGRPFVPGEIRHFPQVLVNGTPILTQADVKNRYPDKSVKFAVISVVIPSIPAKGALTLSFADQRSGNNKPRLSRNLMLAPNFDFDAAFTLTQSGNTVYADARNMLRNGDYTHWTSGTVADTIILVDNSAARKYDIGFDAYKSVRPEFIATFWPSLNKVEIRVVGENEDSQDLEDVTASVAITIGNNSPQTVYTNPDQGSYNSPNQGSTTFTTYAGTNWNKTFWIGGAPDPKIDIDNNIRYLSATKFIPNFDPSLKAQFTSDVIAQFASKWTEAPNDLYQAGLWQKSMGTTGGRPDIGIEPGWMMDWLYNRNYQLRQIALGQADLAGSWLMMVREGDATHYYDRAQTIPAIGLPLSMFAYPNEYLFQSHAGNQITIYDENIPHPPLTTLENKGGLGWQFETSHEPDPFSVPYMLTGDPFYLEELQTWVSSEALMTPINPKASLPANYPDVARTASPVIAGFGAGDVRGNAWALRNRVRAWFLSPDNSPEKAYFAQITTDMIAEWEGAREIYDPALDSLPAWKYGNTEARRPFISPLHFFLTGNEEGTLCPPEVSDAFVHGMTYCESPWMAGYLMMALGNAKDLGYPTDSLLAWMAPQWTDQIGDPNYNPKLIATYKFPIEAGGQPPLFANWEGVRAELTEADQKQTVEDFDNSISDYAVIATGAIAMAAHEPGGAGAWRFANTKVRENTAQLRQYIDNNESSWDILPRVP